MKNKDFKLIKHQGNKNKEDVDYNTTPSFLGNVGIKYFCTNKISLGADFNILLRKEKYLPKSYSDDSVHKINLQLDESTEKHRSIQGFINISYHFGG